MFDDDVGAHEHHRLFSFIPFGASTSQRPSYLIKTPAEQQQEEEEEGRGGGGGGWEEKSTHARSLVL